MIWGNSLLGIKSFDNILSSYFYQFLLIFYYNITIDLVFKLFIIGTFFFILAIVKNIDKHILITLQTLKKDRLINFFFL